MLDAGQFRNFALFMLASASMASWIGSMMFGYSSFAVSVIFAVALVSLAVIPPLARLLNWIMG